MKASAAAGTAPPPKATRVFTVGVLKEVEAGERRVAIVPETVAALLKADIRVLIESGSGLSASFPDTAYREAGASVVAGDQVLAGADAVVTVGVPSAPLVSGLRPGQAVIGMLRPLAEPALAKRLADRGVTTISLDGLPRTVSRAQSMDALTSQANVAGYKSVLVAANAFGRFFPLLITAAGTTKPASLLVIGAGVAGLQAMGTAHRLGAIVTGYDVRPETEDQIRSVGARSLRLKSVVAGGGAGGYARSLTAEEHEAQQQELDEHISRFDVVITTAQVPGSRPPLLVTAAALTRMAPGSVVVDLAAGPAGGNVEGSVPGEANTTDNGVTVIGAGNLPSQMPAAASTAYSHNVAALLADLVRDGKLVIDTTDEIQAGVVVCHGGRVVHPAVAAVVEHQHQGRGR